MRWSLCFSSWKFSITLAPLWDEACVSVVEIVRTLAPLWDEACVSVVENCV